MTIQTIRPNAAHLADYNVTITGGGGTSYGALGDNSDASYVRFDTTNAYTSDTYSELTTYTLAAGESVKRFRSGFRHRGYLGNTTYQLNTGVTSESGPYQYWSGIGTSPAGRAAFGTDYSSWQNSPLTQAQIDSLWIHIQGYDSATTPTKGEVADVWIELDINHIPTTTVSLPTGAQTTPTPTATWTFSDSDGDTQTKYWVKVFSAAQYGAGGFDPETSAFTQSSGEIAGAGLTRVLSSLIDGTYKAYVKVYDGTAYSAWAAGPVFTIASTPPTAPLAPVATDEASNFRVKLDLQAYINGLSYADADMEAASNWVTTVNCTTSQSATFANNGSNSLRLSSTAAGDMSATTTTAGRVAVVVGATYRGIAAARAGASARSCRLDLQWFDVGGSLLSTTTGGTLADATGSFTNITAVSGVAPASATTVGLKLTVLATGAAAELHYFDTMQITPTSTAITWGRGGLLANAVFQVQRSSDAGVTWADITTSDSKVVDADQAITIHDWAVTPSSTVVYRARITTTASDGTPYISAWSANSNSLTPSYASSTTGWLLKDPLDASRNIELPLVNPPFSYNSEEEQGVYKPLNRANPVVVSGQLRGNEFNLDMEFLTLVDFNAFTTIRSGQRTLLLQQTDSGRQWYIRLGPVKSTKESNTTPIIYMVSMNAVEVDAV